MKKITLNIYEDPGHGWAKVKKDLLVKLGIADQITCFSYQRGDYVYLEEDMDLGTLLGALKNRGVSVKFREFHTNKSSKIRSYNSFSKKEFV